MKIELQQEIINILEKFPNSFLSGSSVEYHLGLSNNGKMIECRFIIYISDDYIFYLQFYFPIDNKIKIEFESSLNKLFY